MNNGYMVYLLRILAVQGDVYRSCVVSARSVSTPKLQTMMEMPVCAGEPCVMIVDIWGNRRFYLPRRRY